MKSKRDHLLFLALALTLACAGETHDENPQPAAKGAVAPEHSGTIPVGADQLTYGERGEGCTVVLLAGGSGMDRRQWDSVAPSLAREFRVIALDPRGIGDTDPPSETWLDADDFVEAFAHLDVDRPVVVGLSSAGGAALELAAVHPREVTAVVAVAPFVPGFEFSDEMLERLNGFNAAAQAGREPFLDAMFADPHFFPAVNVPDARTRGREVMGQVYDRMARIDPAFVTAIDPPLLERLPDIDLPVLLLAGGLDHPEVLRRNRFVRDTLPDATEQILAGVGHNGPMEDPDGFLEAVLPFLREHCAAR